MHNSLLEYQSLPIKSLAFNVQVTRMQAHVKIQAVKNWNNPLLNWLSCLLCLHRLHCLLGGFSCCLHRLLCHDVECLENWVTLLRLQLSPWATPHEEFCLAYVNTCCSIFLNIHNTYTWMWAAVREALPLWVIWSLGACDMGPGLHYYIILLIIITWKLCRHRFVAYIEIIFHQFPAAFAMLCLVVFAKNMFHPKRQSNSLRILISLCIPLSPYPLLFHTLTPIPRGLLLMLFDKNLAEDQHGSKPCPSSQVCAGSSRLGAGYPHSEVV